MKLTVFKTLLLCVNPRTYKGAGVGWCWKILSRVFYLGASPFQYMFNFVLDIFATDLVNIGQYICEILNDK